MKKQHLGMALGFALLCCSAGAGAQGVLDRVAAGGQLVLAHRESSVPFSYVHQGKPMGYAVDLCLRLAEAVRRKTGMKDMAVAFLQVTPENRMAMVEQGKADLECGSTTNNAERREKVAFTIPHFITGTRLLMKASSKVTRMEDLAGKKLVSTRGTTAYKVAEKAARERLMGFTLLEAPDHARAVEMVEKGEADAFAMDDVLLYSLAASRPNPKALKVEGRFLTTEALAIALPVGIWLPMVLGGGEELIGFAEKATSGIGFLVILLVAKMLFTSTSFGSGVPGGIFMPILASGTLAGSIMGLVAVHAGVPQEHVAVFAVCAMAGTLAASVKAPVTSILLTVEMSGTLVHMLPVTACAFVALLVSDLLHISPIYSALLDRYVQAHPDDGTALRRDSAGRASGNAVMEFAVEAGSPVAGRALSDVSWPSGAAIVDIRRGDDEIVPTSTTVVEAGDYLLVMFPATHLAQVRSDMAPLCGASD